MFSFVKNKDSPRSGNIFMWVGLFLGNGMLMCAYSMEWYARQTCPPKQVGGSTCSVWTLLIVSVVYLNVSVFSLSPLYPSVGWHVLVSSTSSCPEPILPSSSSPSNLSSPHCVLPSQLGSLARFPSLHPHGGSYGFPSLPMTTPFRHTVFPSCDYIIYIIHI